MSFASRRVCCVFAVVCGSLVSVSAAAQSPASPATPPALIDLQALLHIVREVSPRLALERLNVRGAEANRITAGAYPNPTLSHNQSRPGSGERTVFDARRQDQTTVELPLLVYGQRAARIEKAEREIEAARARVAAGASTLAAEAGAAYIALLAAQTREAQLNATLAELVRLRDVVAGRAGLGAASRYDLTRMEVEVGGFRTRLAEAQADIADQSGTLAALLGIADWQPRAGGKLEPLVLKSDAYPRAAERAMASPAARAAIEEENAARSAVELARRERAPAVSVNAGRAWTTSPHGSANSLGLAVEIPLFDTRRGPLARAEAEAAQASMRRELATAEVSANLQRYANVIRAREAALARFDKEAASRLPQLKEMSETAYRLGRGSVFELLDATRSRHELQQTRIDLLSALCEAQLRYLAISGELDRRAGALAR
jgi:cobalt-zinc-cadmium efflux system outer membrane protein